MTTYAGHARPERYNHSLSPVSGRKCDADQGAIALGGCVGGGPRPAPAVQEPAPPLGRCPGRRLLWRPVRPAGRRPGRRRDRLRGRVPDRAGRPGDRRLSRRRHPPLTATAAAAPPTSRRAEGPGRGRGGRSSPPPAAGVSFSLALLRPRPRHGRPSASPGAAGVPGAVAGRVGLTAEPPVTLADRPRTGRPARGRRR